MEDYDDLSPLQRKAHLVFWYESEVQNGGHGQYFENLGTGQLTEVANALLDLNLSCQASILSRAAVVFSKYGPDTAWEDVLNGGQIEEFDNAFHNCKLTILFPFVLYNSYYRPFSAEFVAITLIRVKKRRAFGPTTFRATAQRRLTPLGPL